MPPIQFTEQQRRDLSKLGLPVEVIDAIEIDALPRAKEIILRREPRRTEVIDELQSVRRALSDARDAVERLLAAPRSVSHLSEARANIGGRAYRYADDRMALKRTLAGLAESVKVMDRAIAAVPLGSTRHRSANTRAIETIHDALQLASDGAGFEFHPPGLEPSSSPTSAFRKMIGICYEVMDTKHPDPERALRAYLKQWRVLTAAVKRGPMGQNVPKESDVPS